MKESAYYVKIVEWSNEDQCYVGSAPGLIYGGYHSTNEREIFARMKLDLPGRWPALRRRAAYQATRPVVFWVGRSSPRACLLNFILDQTGGHRQRRR